MCLDVWVSASEKNKEEKKIVAGEEGCSITDLTGGGKDLVLIHSSI